MQFIKGIKKFYYSNRLPIVVAIDSVALEAAFTSLDESKYAIAKNIIYRLIQDIRNDCKLYNTVEICFISNKKTNKLDFCRTDKYIFNGAEMCYSAEDMIQCAYENLFFRIKMLQDAVIGYYTPLVIFIGDEEFEIVNKDIYKEKHVNTIIINIGKTTWNPVEDENIETFSIASMANAQRFDIIKIIKYVLDGYHMHSHTHLDEMKNFHNYCGALRRRLVAEKVTQSSANIAEDDIINVIRADMEALLAELTEE